MKHKLADLAASSSKSIKTFYKSSAPSSRDLEIAAAEGAWVYHTFSENRVFVRMTAFLNFTGSF